MKTKLVIYGLGPFAELMHYHFTHDSDYEVAAFCVDRAYLASEQFCGLDVAPFEEVEERYPPNVYRMFAAIGYSRMRNRPVMFNKAKDKGYTLVNYISSKAIVSGDLRIGENNVIKSSTDIDPFVTIGDNNVFWTSCILGHNLAIGNHNYCSGRAGLAGNCKVGDLCFMGNATGMINDLHIADETYIVAGTIVMRDTQIAAKYYGYPARKVGTHKNTGIIVE